MRTSMFKCFTATMLVVVMLLVLLMLSLSVCAVAEENPAYEYFYRQLSPNHQAIYRAIVDAPMEQVLRTVVLPEAVGDVDPVELFYQASEAVNHDHQELKAAATFPDIEFDTETNTLTFTIQVSAFAVEEMKQAEKLIEYIAAGADANWDRYTKYLYISNVITGSMQYNIDIYNTGASTFKVGAYSNTYLGINEGEAVCGGYSSLFKVLADRLGLPCVEVVGMYGEAAHGWNAVLMEDGNWYMVEPQSKDGLCGSLQMEQNQYYPANDWYVFTYPEIGAEDNYLYDGEAIDPGAVDLTELRNENDATETTFLYEITSDGCVITDFRGLEAGDLFIPEEIDGYTVRGIGPGAFAYSDFDGMLFIPQTVEYIDAQAFYNCHFTGELNLPSSLQWIGSEAFNDCEGFNNHIFLPEGLMMVEACAFAGMTGVGGVYLPASLEKWDGQIVDGCTNMWTYMLADNHPSFSVVDGVLYSKDMTRLISCPYNYYGALTVPEGVETIGKFALTSIPGITSLHLPSTLECVEQAGCSFLSGLTEPLEIPQNLKRLENGAFQMVWLTPTLVLPELDEIGRHAFAFCWGVETLIVPEGIKDLGPTTFFWCFSLKEIFLPSTLESVAEECLELDFRVKVYGYEGTEAEALVKRTNRSDVTFHPMVDGMGLSEHRLELSTEDPSGVAFMQLEVKPFTNGTAITWASSDETVAVVDGNGLVTAVGEGNAEITAKIGTVMLSCPVGVYTQVLYSADGKTLIRVAGNFTGELVILEGTEVIASNAIDGIAGITNIQFPETLRRIETDAINMVNCRVAFELKLPPALEYIGAGGLNCGKFKSMTYPLGVEVCEAAFNAIRTETLIIPEGIVRLPSYVFGTGRYHSADYIGACFLPASLTYAPINAFQHMPVGVFYGYRGTYAEDYVMELQRRYPEMGYTFVALPRYIDPNTVALDVGEGCQLDWYTGATWSSSNTDIASVSASGRVTAVANGAATITATLDDGASTCCYIMIGGVTLPGDVNNDSVVNEQDVHLYMAWYCDKEAVINAINADVNGDGEIDMLDIITLQEMFPDADDVLV